MINVCIYLDSQRDARALVSGLMERDLLVHASIDKDHHSMQKINGKIVEQSNVVITGQSKALLFNTIVDFIHEQGIENARVYSVPITQCNENFSEMIRKNTLKI